jgi:nucleotide-binding universal stress UspA family protein
MLSTKYKILYPVDFSKRSTLAAQQVKAWVEHFRAALDTLHIVANNASGPLTNSYDPALYQKQSRVVARRTADLKHFSDHYFGKNVARSVVLNGDRADQIQHFADREQADLIMLPRNHQRLIARIFHDSLTATLLEHCKASIWMTEHLENAIPSVPNNILCAVQFGPDATADAHNHRILQTVRDLVSSFQARVTFVHITGDKDTSESSPELRMKTLPMLWLEQARGLFGSSVKLLKTSGSIIAGIRDTAGQIGADLVVVGRMHPGALSFGRQSRILKIDHAVHCPVLSVW